MYLCIYHYHQHLNTSYVDIKPKLNESISNGQLYLNTSYVDIKQATKSFTFDLIPFKYILC